MSFDEDKNRQIQAYKEEFIAVLEGDVEELIARHDLEPEEGEEASVYDYINSVILGNFEPESGFMLNKNLECDLFDDNVSYVRFHRAVGGPGADYIIGSNGDAVLKYSWGGLHLENISGSHEHSVLFELAEMAYGEVFTKNLFEMDEYELSLRLKEDLGVESFKEFVNDNASKIDCETVSFDVVFEFLENNEYNLEAAVQDILDKEEFYVCDVEGKNFSAEDFINDIKTHIQTIEELANDSDFETACQAFGVNADLIGEIDFDNLEEEIKKAFEPEVEVKNKVKPKI